MHILAAVLVRRFLSTGGPAMLGYDGEAQSGSA